MRSSLSSSPAGRRWIFRVAAIVVVPLALLLAIEGALRMTGYGYSPHFFLKRRISDQPVCIDNQEFGKRFFPPGLVRYPRPLTFPAVKPADTVRIFVLGESAAMGDPDPKFGLPRMVEVLLRERFPSRRFEVVNAAMVAINSHVIRSIAQDCATRQGDLWMIYMGNNEMIGPFGSASVFGAQSPPLPVIRAALWTKTTRLGQFLDAAAHSLPTGQHRIRAWDGMEMMSHLKVDPDGLATARVYSHFERNLADILSTGTSAGVPIVLCTVATNLKDCAPFASMHRGNLSAAELDSWQMAYDLGVARLNQGDPAGAKAAFDEAARIDNQYGELAYRRAECCRRLGQTGEAAKLYLLARDRDALQFRADDRINNLIRRAAAASASRGVSLVDAEELMATNSPHGAAGAEFFYEHVHLTPEGNYLLARALAEQAAKVLALESSRAWLSSSGCFALLGLTDWNRYDALQIVLDRIQGAPFTNQVNYADELRGVNEQITRYRLATKPALIKRELQQVSELVSRFPKDPDLRANLAGLQECAGDQAGAEASWRVLLSLQPHAVLPHLNLAKLLERLNRPAEAHPLYETALRINPDYYPARYALGTLCLRLGRVPEAIRHLELTVEQKPASVEPRLALSQALVLGQRPAEAERQLREVLRLDPNNASARGQIQALGRGVP